ncbi:MAG: hypothetical protein HUJ26_19020 [Planctomycetaceae bacterium]|nr:hypothetical protein [Planctomycetaceae bacterium]
MFNPPEPNGHTTNLEGVDRFSFNTFPAGGNYAIPPAFKVNFAGEGRDPLNNPTEDIVFFWEQLLVGEHVLELQQKPWQIPSYIRSGGRLAYYRTKATIPGYSTLPLWTLFYAPFGLELGPYLYGGVNPLPGFSMPANWYLISEYDGDYALQIYYNVGSAEDKNNRSTAESTFDALGSNKFQILSWYYSSPQNVAVSGLEENIEVEVHAYWP